MAGAGRPGSPDAGPRWLRRSTDRLDPLAARGVMFAGGGCCPAAFASRA